MRQKSKQRTSANTIARSARNRHLGQGIRRLALTGALTLAGAALPAAAQSKAPAVSDAQVESSVLQALAKTPGLAGQQITSTSVYGVVTLTGHVPDEATRSLAEDVVSRTAGVTKVVDELTLGAATPSAQNDSPSATSGTPTPDAQADSSHNGMVLQSDGTYAPQDNTADAQPQASTTDAAPIEQGSPEQASGQPAYDQGQYGNPPQQAGAASPGSGLGEAQQQPGPYDGQQPPYGQRSPYGPPQGYANAGQYGGQTAGGPGQQAGVPLTVPAGAILQLRLNQPVDSRHSPVGSAFTGVLQQDVVISGYVALPRGATVQGVVADASNAGALKGRASLGLELSQITIGGQTYPLTSNLWSQTGGDKTVRTVDSALGLGVLGAIVGGVAGGGAGAAIGAGVGGATGVGASAASGGGAVVLPPESVLTFRLAQPLQIATVSQAELNRLAYNAPAYGPQRMMRRYPAYYPYGPVYYPGYYRPYPYRAYPY